MPLMARGATSIVVASEGADSGLLHLPRVPLAARVASATTADASSETPAPGLMAHQPDRPARTPEEAFIFPLVEPAQESQLVTGVPTSVTIAQAILETYWGSSFLAREANNYFGIKAQTKPGSDGVVWIDAWEVEGGQNIVRPEPFRKYLNVVESLVDHGRFFLENSRYRHALEAKDDAREFARRINVAGYATDPAYASKLISYMDRYDLYQYDLRTAKSEQ